jgi:3D (Asp-Asp-Asp) domain-containing protein
VEAYVTGYNTVRRQTDNTPCIAASGANICGRRDTAACPRLFDLGTVVEIKGRKYVCEDRMAARFKGSFDINCDKDTSCPYKVFGWTTVRVYLE